MSSIGYYGRAKDGQYQVIYWPSSMLPSFPAGKYIVHRVQLCAWFDPGSVVKIACVLKFKYSNMNEMF